MLDGIGAYVTEFLPYMEKLCFLTTPSLIVISALCVVRGRSHRLLCYVAVWNIGLILNVLYPLSVSLS